MIKENDDISVLGMNNRAVNTLRNNNINTVGQLLNKSRSEIKDLWSIGWNTIQNMEKCLERVGLSIGCGVSALSGATPPEVVQLAKDIFVQWMACREVTPEQREVVAAEALESAAIFYAAVGKNNQE